MAYDLQPSPTFFPRLTSEARASALNRTYDGWEAEAALTEAITADVPGRIALTSSFGAQARPAENPRAIVAGNGYDGDVDRDMAWAIGALPSPHSSMRENRTELSILRCASRDIHLGQIRPDHLGSGPANRIPKIICD